MGGSNMTEEERQQEENERWDNTHCCDCGADPEDDSERLSMFQFGQCDRCYRYERDRNAFAY
jgi:hypothetical protein